MNVKKIAVFIPLLLINTIFPAASSSSCSSSKNYIEELSSWHVTCKTTFPSCTMLQSCAMILKQRNFPLEVKLPDPESSEASSSSAAPSAKSPSSYPLEYYTQFLKQNWEAMSKVYLLCKEHEACAFLLEQFDHTHTKEYAAERFEHPNASKSILWPSPSNLKAGSETLQNWYEICSEMDEDCDWISACNLILTHQLKMLNVESKIDNLQMSCSEALEDAIEHLQTIFIKSTQAEACAYCIMLPATLISSDIIQNVSKKLSYVSDYIKKQKETKLMEGCYSIATKPRMSLTWQQAVSAGYSPNLVLQMLRHHRIKDNPRDMFALPKGYIFHGYPGVGKSSAARMFAMIYQRPFLKIRCEAIQTKWQASAVENLNAILAPILNSNDPWVVVLEELDSLQKTSPTESGDRSNALTLLQSWIDDNKNKNLLMIGTSNYMKDIPDSLESRVNIIHVPLPDSKARSVIAQAYLDSANIKYNAEMIKLIANKTGGMLPWTDGLTGREIRKIVYELYHLLGDKIHVKGDTDPIAQRKRVATLDLVHLAIDKIKDEKAKGGKPLTIEGRKWKEFRDSKDFWPAIQAGASYCSLVWSIAQGSHGMYIASQQLGVAREGLKISKHTADTGDTHLENSDAQLIISLFNDKKTRERAQKTLFGRSFEPIIGDNTGIKREKRPEYAAHEEALMPYIEKVTERTIQRIAKTKKQ